MEAEVTYKPSFGSVTAARINQVTGPQIVYFLKGSYLKIYFYALIFPYFNLYPRYKIFPWFYPTDTKCSGNFFLFLVQFVRKPSGNQLAIINGFTYYCAIKNKTSNAWRCTKGGNCKARFTLLSTNEILRSYLVHDHPPPRFCIRDGILLKIWFFGRRPIYRSLSTDGQRKAYRQVI